MFRFQKILRWTLMVTGIAISVSFFIHQFLAEIDTSKYTVIKTTEWQVPGPDTFCPPFDANSTFTKSIFFIEIPCNRPACLTPRSVCGIESTARTNPNVNISVHILTRSHRLQDKKRNKRPRPGQVVSCEVTETLRRFTNIRIIEHDLESVFNEIMGRQAADTLFAKTSEWTTFHAKELLKLGLLKTYGGAFLDTNIINFRPLHCLRNTAVYFSRTKTFGTQVLIFDPSHPFLEFAVRSFTLDYEPYRRDTMGPARLAEAFEVFCNTTNQTEFHSGKHYSCHKTSQIHAVAEEAFYPVDRLRTIKFFQPWLISDPQAVKISARFSQSYLAYVDGATWGLSVPVNSLYANLARLYCPTTWNAVEAQPGLDF